MRIHEKVETYYVGEDYCLTPEEASPARGINPLWVGNYGDTVRSSYEQR